MKLVISALAAAVLAGTATAATYDPGMQGANAANFRYGYDSGSGFSAFDYATQYHTSGCPIGGTSCFTGPASFLGVYFAPVDGNYQGALLRSNEVTFHPGPNGEAIGLQFVAPAAGSYKFTGAFRAADAPSGNGVNLFLPNGTALLGVRPDASPFSFNLTLAAGQTAQFSLNSNGSYSYDTTGLSLSVAGVPEPAAWALMIGGFGLIGGTMRHRRSTKITFA